MLNLRKFQADIEDGSKGMTIEFWAADEAQAREKLVWLVGLKSWHNLQEIKG